jgi:uncharacterized protein YgbK (DUF1537 family)
LEGEGESAESDCGGASGGGAGGWQGNRRQTAVIGVIADDLSGAAELGALAVARGMRAEITTGDIKPGSVDVVCVDTDSRACSKEEAARRVTEAADKLRAAGAERIYKKIDSVLRGQVTAEVEALMKHLGFGLAVVVPANPGRGRIIKNGAYLVDGVPIHETEFGRDPEHPKKASEVLKLVDASAHFPITVLRPDVAFPESGIVMAEAESQSDIEQWAARCHAGILAAGAAGFFKAILEKRTPTAPRSVIVHEGAGAAESELFVCGSTSEATERFINGCRSSKVPVFGLPGGLVDGREWQDKEIEDLAREVAVAVKTNPRVILQVGLPPVNDTGISRRLAGHLVELAKRVLEKENVDSVFAEGGATAAELARRMGWTHMEVLEELAPGVAVLGIPGARQVRFSIKPGSYKWPPFVLMPARVSGKAAVDMPEGI